MIGIIVGSALGGLLLILLLTLYFIYRYIYHSPRKGQNNDYRIEPSLDYQGTKEYLKELITKLREIPYEDLWVKAYDGLKLHGLFYRNDSSNTFILMFNGYRGTARSNFSGSAVDAMNMNMNVVLCEQRAHGISDGHSITFGRKEQYDVCAWVDFIKEKWGNSVKIIVAGISMGAATVLLASDKLDPKIKIIADCPYSSQKAVISHMMKVMKFPPKLFWPLAYLAAIIFGHARLKDDALENVKKSKCKILIIHGSKDSVVPYKMSERVYLANKDHVQYELFEGVDHGICYLRDTVRYKKLVEEFLKE